MDVELAAGHWHPTIRATLAGLVQHQAQAGRVAVFDFDNTILCRDIGDATFEVLARSEAFATPLLKALLPPDFEPTPDALLAHYEAICDAAPASAYTWAVQLMAGLTVEAVVAGTRGAWAGTSLQRYATPFLYPEMVHLLGLLLERGVGVYIVSASNVWTVRWVVRHALNPLLKARFGPSISLPPHHIYGLNLLLCDGQTGLWVTDKALVQADDGYATLAPDHLSRYTLTPYLVPPLSTFAGKVATVRTHITDGPIWLAAGDSLNDLPLLQQAQHRLWMARLERPGLQAQRAAAIASNQQAWLIQPVRTQQAPGFVSG